MYWLNDQERLAFDPERRAHDELGDAESRLDGPNADAYRSQLVVASVALARTTSTASP